jgi:hypothetical protein
MKLILFSQRALAWAKHVLGWGGKVGTIGAFGCYDTVCAMIAINAGIKTLTYSGASHPTNPATFDELATSRKVFLKDPTGTFDFLSDHALDDALPNRFKTYAYNGFRADLIAKAIPKPDQYVYLHIVNPRIGVETHYVWALSLTNIADPWYGSSVPLANYGGPAAIAKTYIATALPVKAATAPVATKPAPVATPTPTAPPVPVQAPAAAIPEPPAPDFVPPCAISQPSAPPPEFDPRLIAFGRALIAFVFHLVATILNRPTNKEAK